MLQLEILEVTVYSTKVRPNLDALYATLRPMRQLISIELKMLSAPFK